VAGFLHFPQVLGIISLPALEDMAMASCMDAVGRLSMSAWHGMAWRGTESSGHPVGRSKLSRLTSLAAFAQLLHPEDEGADLFDSNNCVTAKRECEYTVTRIPLRERRAQERQPLQPGEQRPWICWENQSPSPSSSPSRACSVVSPAPPSPNPWQALSGCTAGDPFDTMMVNMQYKSKELFHYFCQSGGYASQQQQDHT
jgi:hypothetical protein